MQTASLQAASGLSLPSDSYVYSIVPCSEARNVAAIASNDSLRIVDASRLQGPIDGTYSNIHAGVTCLRTFPDQTNVLLTAGRDAAIRGWDIRNGERVVELIDPFPLFQLHFQPTNPARLLSGSTDGLINIFDTSISEEEDALVQITNHGSSIHHTNFLDPVTFYGLSHDENFSVYPLHLSSNEETEEEEEGGDGGSHHLGDLRPLLECDYVIDVFEREGINLLAAGSHSTPSISIFPLLRDSNSTYTPSPQGLLLPNGHGADVVRTVCTNGEVIFTGGEDGMVRVWGVGC